MLRTVIFDLDGTLYDNRCLHWMLPFIEMFYFRLGYLGRERSSRNVLRNQTFADSEDFYTHFYSSISASCPDKASRWYHSHYLPLQAWILRHFCKADAWVLPRLNELRSQGIRLVLFSDYGFAEQKLRALGLDPQLFDLVVDAPSLGGLKPSEEVSRRLLHQLGMEPAEVLFVGDREDCDVAAARKVGAQYQLVVRRGKEVTFSNILAS